MDNAKSCPWTQLALHWENCAHLHLVIAFLPLPASGRHDKTSTLCDELWCLALTNPDFPQQAPIFKHFSCHLISLAGQFYDFNSIISKQELGQLKHCSDHTVPKVWISHDWSTVSCISRPKLISVCVLWLNLDATHYNYCKILQLCPNFPKWERNILACKLLLNSSLSKEAQFLSIIYRYYLADLLCFQLNIKRGNLLV